MSIYLKFVELTADVLETIFIQVKLTVARSVTRSYDLAQP